jgi:hypothetical protein
MRAQHAKDEHGSLGYSARVRKATLAIAVVWLLAVARLFIADVWDETNGLVVFKVPGQTVADIVKAILKTPLPFWRPIPTIFAALVIHWTPPEFAWRFLRAVNIALILGALALLLRTLQAWSGRDDRRDFFFALTMLFSGGAIIVATWYANLFDAFVMFFIALALHLIQRGRFIAAGVLLGVAFFFKETVAIALPLLVLLIARDRLRVKEAIRTAVPAIAGGVFYFALRSLVVPFGSAADTHQFHLTKLGPTALIITNTLWSESTWGASWTILGFVWFAFSIFAMRGWRARVVYLGYVAALVLMYLEMFGWQQELMSHLMFAGRLYFIPVALILFVLALDGRWWALPVLAVPLLIGAVITYRHYDRFQHAYRNIYRHTAKPIRIYYPQKPLHDPRRGIEIGDLPDAPYALDPQTGKLVGVPR